MPYSVAAIRNKNFGNQSPLLDSLRFYYKLDEASGVALDQVNGFTLTDNNTVGTAAGLIGTSRQFVAASSEYLSRADDALLTFTGSYTISGWMWFDSLPAAGSFSTLVAKDNGAQREYWVNWYRDALEWRFRHKGVTTATRAGTPTLAAWYHVCAWYDNSNGSANLSINNGAIGTTMGGTAGTDTTAIFTMGVLGNLTAGFFHNGRIDEVGLWARVLLASERTQLYNGGVGVTYPTFI